MSLYADYIKEFSGDSIIETPYGFATYRFLNDKQCYIVDIYIMPKDRTRHMASNIADEICRIALDRGCSEILGSVCTAAKDPTTSIKVLLGYGMTLSHIDGNLIVFKKYI